MTASKLPPHGTVQRYRLEVKLKREGKGDGACVKCRAANSARARDARTNAAAKARRAAMAIVDDVTPEGHSETRDKDSETPPERGEMEKSIAEDLDAIDVTLRVPFHKSLSALALQTAREIDDPDTSPAARRDARRQLFEVLKSLRTQKEDGNASALDVLLEQAGVGLPLVPDRPA